MPSANTRSVVATAATAAATTAIPPPDYHHRLRADVEGLVLEIKENLRISSTCAVGALKAMPAYRRYPKKYLRNSPYAGVRSADEQTACARRLLRQKAATAADDVDDDPYELLQRLLKTGGLVGEAVRRVQLATSFARADYCYYDSDEESSRSPVLVLRGD